MNGRGDWAGSSKVANVVMNRPGQGASAQAWGKDASTTCAEATSWLRPAGITVQCVPGDNGETRVAKQRRPTKEVKKKAAKTPKEKKAAKKARKEGHQPLLG